MDNPNLVPRQTKISPALLAHLARLRPKQRLRAIVVLDTGEAGPRPSERRPTPAERQAAIIAIRNRASQALEDIDAILARFGGRRLSDGPSAVGTIAVESTSAGIAALSDSDYVKAILQDQPITRIS